MARVFLISPSHTFKLHHSLSASSVRHLTSFTPLIKALFKDGRCEKDVSEATVIIIDTESPAHASDSLELLSFEEKALLLKYFFSHVNLIVMPYNTLKDQHSVSELDANVASVATIIGTRLSRVAAWTGTGSKKINDVYTDERARHLVKAIIPTMANALMLTCNISSTTEDSIKELMLQIVKSVDFKLLLSHHSEEHLSKLCHCVGHWAFPAHELSNDDLVYCVYLMLDYSIKYVVSTGAPENLELPSDNEILALAFMTRDTYRSGNPFHNFRHAVDVLQACFYYLIRLRCLPPFVQLQEDPKADETRILTSTLKLTVGATLIPTPTSIQAERFGSPLLTPIQSLGLLVAALGHDVGHPGVTNAYMIKLAAPTSQIYNDRSVLELYHSAIFTNKILKIMWPSLLECMISSDSAVSIKQLIIRSILATDMAEHFEYIHKLKDVLLLLSTEEKVQLICSLLIKCADISNVTRPLRISSQWALILSREFDEVDKLEKRIAANDSMVFDVEYSHLPAALPRILEENPNIHDGQIFFINAFAEGLFNSILDHFVELKYTSDIINENKLFWQARAKKFK